MRTRTITKGTVISFKDQSGELARLLEEDAQLLDGNRSMAVRRIVRAHYEREGRLKTNSESRKVKA